MKELLNNQECKIDNHQSGQKTQGLKGVHIHKTMRKNKRYGEAIIRIPLDGKNTEWSVAGENAERLRKECVNALEDPASNKEFVDAVVEEMMKYNGLRQNDNKYNNIKEEYLQIAKRVLYAFKIENIRDAGIKTKTIHGRKIDIFYFENNDYSYSTCLTKSHFTLRGESK